MEQPRHTDDRHYQFRAPKELDVLIQKVWLPNLTGTGNMTRIVTAGVSTILSEKENSDAK